MGDLDWQSIFATLGAGVGGGGVGESSAGGGRNNVDDEEESGSLRVGPSESPLNIDYTLPQHQQYQAPQQRPRHAHRHSLPHILPPPYNDIPGQIPQNGETYPSVPPPTPLIPLGNTNPPHRTMSDHDFYTNLTRSLYSHDPFVNPTPTPHQLFQSDNDYQSGNTGQIHFGTSTATTTRASTSYGPTGAQRELEARTRTRGGRSQIQQPQRGDAGPSTWSMNPPPLPNPQTRPSSRSNTPTPPLQAVGSQTPSSLDPDSEEKRQRNTLASAKFRAKRKQHVNTVQRRITELEDDHKDLERDVHSLRQENKFLREMVQMKYGLDVDKHLSGSSGPSFGPPGS